MIKSNYFETVISYIAISWTFIGVLLILRNNRDKQPKKRYSIVLLIVYSFHFVINLLFPYFEITPYILFEINKNLNFVYGPMLFLFYKEILKNDKKSNKKITIHFVPFLLSSLAYLSIRNINLIFQNKAQFCLIICGQVSVLLYGIYIYKDISRYNKLIDNQFSSHETEITLSWLKIIAIGYIFFFGLSFFLLFLMRPTIPSIPKSYQRFFLARGSANIPLVLFILTFILNSLNQDVIVFDNQFAKDNIESKKSKSLFLEKELTDCKTNLETYMKEFEPFLDCNLTLYELSKKTGISRNKLSGLIMEGFDSNFYIYINSYRIAKFEELVWKGKNKELSIVGLAFECGFKGSSSFYNAMKKEKGITPKQLIKQIELKKVTLI